MSLSIVRTASVFPNTCCGPRPCISSCIRMCVKNASNETFDRSAAASATPEIGVSTLSNFACCTFFSITRFEPFSRTTRSSFGRLNAAVWTPRLASPAVKTTLTTRMRRERAELRAAELRIDRQRVLESLQFRAEHAELLRLGIVAQRDERFERGLVAEPDVLVGLVRADRRLDRRVQLHPRHVAGVVVVAEEAVGAELRGYFLSDGCVGERGRFAQERGGCDERVLVDDGIGHRHEPAGLTGPSADDGEEAFRFVGGGALQRVEPRLDLFLRRVLRIEVRLRRLRRHLELRPQERRVFIEPRPRAFVQDEVVEFGGAFRRPIGSERRQRAGVAGPHLVEEQPVHQSRRGDELRERLALLRRQRVDVGRDVHRREAPELRVDARDDAARGARRSRRLVAHRRRGRRLTGCAEQREHRQQVDALASRNQPNLRNLGTCLRMAVSCICPILHASTRRRYRRARPGD